MAWHNEPRRHSLASKGVKTAVDKKPFTKVSDKNIKKIQAKKLAEIGWFKVVDDGKGYKNYQSDKYEITIFPNNNFWETTVVERKKGYTIFDKSFKSQKSSQAFVDNFINTYKSKPLETVWGYA